MEQPQAKAGDEVGEDGCTSGQPQPTAEMVAYFYQRTRKHIDLVAQNIERMIKGNIFTDQELLIKQLRERGTTHDASKYSPEEQPSYIWLTEWHRANAIQKGSFAYPTKEIEEGVLKAIELHKSRNPHHPEHYGSDHLAEKMSDIDLHEMVSDWAAIAQELSGDAYASPRPYFESTAIVKYKFSERTTRKVEAIIAKLEAYMAAEKSAQVQQD